MACGKDNPEQVRQQFKTALASSSVVTVDLAGLRSLSPSFAYEAFGKLVDDFGFEVSQRIQYVNDAADLQSRIKDALKRRDQILHPNAS